MRTHSFDPFLRATVTKWSDKVLAASGLAAGGKGDKKFKAVNQNAMAQIDHALSATGERERLVRRTKVRRGEGKPVGAVAAAGHGDEEEENVALTPLDGGASKPSGGAGGAKEVDDECFDDSDFYQQLLRDVVESRMLDLGQSAPRAVLWLSSRFVGTP